MANGITLCVNLCVHTCLSRSFEWACLELGGFLAALGHPMMYSS